MATYGFCENKCKHEVLGATYKGACDTKETIIDTGVSVNGGYGGKAYLIAYSYHTSSGNNTGAGISLLRCGFDGNNYEITSISSSRGEGDIALTFGISESGTLTYMNSNSGISKVSVYPLT